MGEYDFNVDIVMNVISKNMGAFNNTISKSTKGVQNLNQQMANISNKAGLAKLFGDGQVSGIEAARKAFTGITSSASEQLKYSKLLNADLQARNRLMTGLQQSEQQSLKNAEQKYKIETLFNKIVAQSTQTAIKASQANEAQKIANTQQTAISKLQESSKLGAISQDAFNSAMKKAGLEVNAYGKYVDVATGKIVSMKRAQDLIIKNNKKMDFGFLSAIFGGMALQRTFGTMYKTMQTSYTQMADTNDSFVQGLDNLGGALEYVKFSMFDAFANSPFISGLLDGLIETLVNVGDWANKNPGLAATLTAMAGALAIIGTAMVGIGQIRTLNYALDFFKEMKSVNAEKFKNLATGMNQVDTARNKWSKWNTIGVGFGIISTYQSVSALTKDFKKNGFSGSTIGYAIAGALGVAGAIVSVFNPGIGIGLSIASQVVNKITDYTVETKNEKKMQKETAKAINEILGDNKIDINTVFGESLADKNTLLSELENQLKALGKEQDRAVKYGDQFTLNKIAKEAGVLKQKIAEVNSETDDLETKLLAVAVADLYVDRNALDAKLREEGVDESLIKLTQDKIRGIDEQITAYSKLGQQNAVLFNKELQYAKDNITYLNTQNTIRKDSVSYASEEANEAERKRDAEIATTTELQKQNTLRGVRTGASIEEYIQRQQNAGRTVITSSSYTPNTI